MMNGNLHIEGYPDASVLVEIPSPLGRRLADLRMHQVDLAFCERAMQSLANETLDPPSVAAEALWIAAITKFFSCFGSGGRAQLNASAVFKAMPDARTAFEYYRSLRNKHVVHDENNLNYAVAGVALRADGSVCDVISLHVATLNYEREVLQTLYNLIAHVQGYVGRKIDEVHKACFAALEVMDPQQRLALPKVIYRAPLAEDVDKPRSAARAASGR